MKYEIRTNCEYVLELEAGSEDEALDQAGRIPVEEWFQAWAPMEMELMAEATGPAPSR